MPSLGRHEHRHVPLFSFCVHCAEPDYNTDRHYFKKFIFMQTWTRALVTHWSSRLCPLLHHVCVSAQIISAYLCDTVFTALSGKTWERYRLVKTNIEILAEQGSAHNDVCSSAALWWELLRWVAIERQGRGGEIALHSEQNKHWLQLRTSKGMRHVFSSACDHWLCIPMETKADIAMSDCTIHFSCATCSSTVVRLALTGVGVET